MSSPAPARYAPLQPVLARRVCERLGWPLDSPRDLPSLTALYHAWGQSIPFDNTRKLVALLTGDAGALPGIDATDFFEHWLAQGTGGTCWPSSNALHALLSALGFAARRVAGSMRDLGVVSHASAKVRLDGKDWLVDSSLLVNVPLPLDGTPFVGSDPIYPVRIEPAGDTHLVRWAAPNHTELLPLRLLVDPASYELYQERYERSRETSPFNQRLYARRNRPDALVLLVGHRRLRRTRDGVEVRELSARTLQRALRDDIGLSDEFVALWNASGALEASMTPVPAPTR